MFRKVSLLYGLLLTLLLTTAACQPIQPVSAMKAEKADTTRQENQAVVQRFYEEVVNQKHVDVMKEVFDAEMVEHNLGYIPDTGVRDVDLFAAFPDMQLKVDLWVIEGDLLTAVVTVSGTHTGAELAGVAPSGNPVTFSQIDIWHVENGKITEVWHNFAVADILEQIGYTLVPPAE
jgi:predicted ester cyclase